ncbi:hypothetical protein [Streptomyces paludis]|uniref:Uncharacterized protein n=1 Tax=Streptomyces paludis TaxID=2282738 RepID=A0A345I1K2_9ACTN|nr:hypothetical protein [Streptomyces paludis]AXG82826.1 hypothetical protein DVK44_22415 [Streptomyces paludis]
MPLLVTAGAVPLYAVWAAFLATGGGDLAAQFAWAGFMARHPGSAYNLSWYGGMHTVNYSVLAPPLMALLGVRTVSVLAGLAGTWAMAALFVRTGVPRALWPALLGAVALWCNVASGRTTFALGVAIGLFALLLVQRRAPGAALGAALPSALAALATLASPVAGLFLVVAGAAYALDRQWVRGASLLVPPALVVGATTLLFPFQGEQPMAPGKLTTPLLVCAVLCCAAPRAWRVVRYGAAVYALGVVLTFLVSSPVGTNVERLVGLAGPPVLLAALLTRGVGPLRDLARTAPRAWRRAGRPAVARPAVLAAVLPALLAGGVAFNSYWLLSKTDDDLAVSTVVPGWATRTDGVVAALERLGADRTRVEVVPARNHREADVLAAHVNMARGWNRQLDVERGRLFYANHTGTDTLDPAAYRAWLDRWAVGLVVVPHGKPDGPAEAEAALVASGPDWLERVWGDADWTVYRVRNAVPLVPAPATVVRGDDAELTVRLPAAGSVTVRIAYSPWLHAPGACVQRDGDWTKLTVTEPGDYRLGSAYRLPRASCGG